MTFCDSDVILCETGFGPWRLSVVFEDTHWDPLKKDLWPGLERLVPLFQEVCFSDQKAPYRQGGMDMAIMGPKPPQCHKLNQDHRGKDAPTNVLTFPSGFDMRLFLRPSLAKKVVHKGAIECPQDTDIPLPISDIILCYPVIKRESDDQQKPIVDHTMHLIVHGFLHSLGFDHRCDEEEAFMNNLESTLMKKLGLKDPHDGSFNAAPAESQNFF